MIKNILDLMSKGVHIMKVKFLVLGGGVTGLSFVNFIQSKDYIIIERDNKLGGYCKTTYFEDYIWDQAGHFFHFKTDYMLNFFKELLNEHEVIKVKKRTKIFYSGNLIDYPFQKNIHQLSKQEFIDCLYDLFNRENSLSINLKDYMINNFGKSIADKFLIPYNEKLYACDLNSLDSNSLGRFFPYANEKEIINNFKAFQNNSYNDYFLYPKKGAQSIIDALKEKCICENIFTNEEVIKIDIENKLVITTNREIEFENIVSTIPFKELLYLTNITYSEPNEKRLSNNKILVFNIGFNKKGPTDIHWIYFPEKEFNFYRVGFYDNILNQNKMSLYVEIGFDSDRILDIDQEFEKVINGLKQCNIITNQVVREYEYVIMNPGYVHIKPDTVEVLSKLQNKLEKYNIFTAGRYGKWKYCSIEESMIDAYSLAKRFNDFNY